MKKSKSHKPVKAPNRRVKLTAENSQPQDYAASRTSHGPRVGDIAIEKIVSSNEVQFAAGSRSGISHYAGVMSKLRTLKEGQSMILPCPQGVDLRTFQNRLTAALRRESILNKDFRPPNGCVLRKRITSDGKVSINCVRRK